MIHEVGRDGKTQCCQVVMVDLPIEDHVTFTDSAVTCNRAPIRNPEQMAQFYAEALHRLDQRSHRSWADLSDFDRYLHLDASRQVFRLLHER